MEKNFLQLFKLPETRQKILRTLGLLLCYRIGFQIPIPGLSPEYLSEMGSKGVFGLLSALSGGSIGQTNIFALGIMPYISASIIFSMLTKISPALEAIAKEGAAGYKKINQWTRLVSVPIAMIQGLFIYTALFAQSPNMVAASMRGHPLALGLIVTLSLIAGSMIVMWLSELITEYGVGNGSSLVIMAGIIAELPFAFYTIRADPAFWQTMLLMVAIWVVVVFVVVFMHKGARRIPIQYAKHMRGRRVYGGQRHFLPLKVNMAGVMPIIFASVIFVIPGVIFDWFNFIWLKTVFSDQTGFVYVTLSAALIFFFCFFWNRLMFRPEEIANNLREHGSFVPGLRPGQQTADYLSSVLTRVTFVGAAFLAMISVLPAFVTKGTGLTNQMQYFIGGTSVLIVVGVALELVDRLQAQLVMKSYDGTARKAGPGWAKAEAE